MVTLLDSVSSLASQAGVCFAIPVLNRVLLFGGITPLFGDFGGSHFEDRVMSGSRIDVVEVVEMASRSKDRRLWEVEWLERE